MDEQVFLRLLAGGFGSGLDLTALVAFIAFAAVYLIAPALGYAPERPAGLAASLYVLIAYVGLSLLQLFVQWIQILDRGGIGGLPGAVRGGESAVHYIFVFAALKMSLFLVAMATFVSGLRSLRPRRADPAGRAERDDRVDQLREENARLRRRLERRGEPGEEGTQEGR